MFVILYAVLRFSVEFSREPDAHIGLLAVGLSMGQLLSVATLLCGLVAMYLSLRWNTTDHIKDAKLP